MKIRLDVCRGISSQRHEVYIFSYKLVLFCGYGMKIGRNLCGGISSKRHKVHILSYKLALFLDLE